VPYTLLLADDSVTIQRVIELTFADEDVDVVAVSDGDQAIARLEASPPDIVLADIGMPGKNGYEVAQYVRRSPRLAHIPVVLLTGAFEPVDQARADEAGCDGVLAKPFEPQLVIGRVKELLARKTRQPVALAPGAARPAIVPDDQWAPPPAVPPVSGSSAEAAAPAALNDYFDRLDAAFSNMSSDASAPTAAPAPSPAADVDWFTTMAPAKPSAEPWDFAAPPELMEPPDLSPAYESPEPPAASFPPFVTPTPADAFPKAVPSALVAFDAGAAPAHFPPPAQVAPPSALADFAPDVLSPPRAPVAPAAPPAASAAIAAPAPSTHAAAVAPPAPSAASADVPDVARPASAPPARPAELPALADAFAALLAAEQNEPLPANAPRWPGTANASPYGTGTPPPAVATDVLVDDITRRVLDRLSDQVVRETVAEIVSTVAERIVREEIERIKASLK
jgi:CheY-like chemotaxis protein